MPKLLERKPRKSRKRPTGRRLFIADAIVNGPTAKLSVRSGLHRTTVDDAGDVVAQAFEKSAKLWANIGDRFVVCGPDLDENCIATVIDIDQRGHLTAAIPPGAIRASCAVRLLPIWRNP